MILHTLASSNFMPYKGKMSIAFPTDKDQNVMLVYGDNMRGKTSLLNALRWVFYGKAVGRHSREIPLFELMNKDASLEGDWSMEVAVTFESDGHRYELIRTANKRAYVAIPSRSEDLEVDRAMRKDDIALPPHLIDSEINRFAPEQTSRFFLFDGELLDEYEQLLIDGSEQSKKIKEAIEQALGVPTLIRGRDDAGTILKQAQKQQSVDLQRLGGLEEHANKQRFHQTQIDSIEDDITELNVRLRSVTEERMALDDELEKTEALYQAKQKLTDAKVAENKNEADQAQLNNERLVHIKDAWREIVRPLLTIKREHLHQENTQLTEQMFARNHVVTQIAQLKEAMKSDKCQTCGQSLHEKERAAAGALLGTLESNLLGMKLDQASFNRISSEIQALDKLLKPTNAALIPQLDRQIAKLRVEQTQIGNEIEKLNDIVQGQDTAEIARQRAKRDGLIREATRISGDIKTAQANLDKHQKDLAMISKVLQGMPTARAQKSTQLVNIASVLEKIYARSIDRLRNDLKLSVERLASAAFKKLTTQGLYSGLRINSNYGLTILDERGQEVTVRSAGAEQIVALSLIDGLAHAGRSAGPVVMDTPFGRLDPKHRSNILNYLPTTTPQLVLFVHEGEVNRTTDLAGLGSKIGAVYEIQEVSPRHSRMQKVTQ
jgi:DNA sulfur modification protein DndD